MGYKMIVLFWCGFLLATVQSMMVNMSYVWKPNLGWEVTCSWELYEMDSLQQVTLYGNYIQLLFYRPAEDGDKRSYMFRLPEGLMMVNCTHSMNPGVMSNCTFTLELIQSQKNNLTYACEVSGEGPRFLQQKKTLVIDAFVPPADAIIEVGSAKSQPDRVMLNCTSSGIPAPILTWTIGKDKVPHDFSGSVWNKTSKLWHAWSLLAYQPSSEQTAVCTPENRRGNQLVQGHTAEYNSAGDVKDVRAVTFAVLISLLLLR